MNRRWIGLAMVLIWALSACVGRAQVVAKGTQGETSAYSDVGAGRVRGEFASTVPQAAVWRDAGASSGTATLLSAGAQRSVPAWSDAGFGATRRSLATRATPNQGGGYRDAGAAAGNP